MKELDDFGLLVNPAPKCANIQLVPMAQAARHAELLFGDQNKAVNFRAIFPDAKREAQFPAKNLHGRVKELWREFELLQRRGYGIFLIVNAGGHRDDEITGITANFIDADGRPMPSEWHVEPSFLVARDETHWHAYWRAVPGRSVAEFTRTQKRLAAHYQTDPAVSNPSRVMRLAGTKHTKNLARPVPVTLVDRVGVDFDLEGMFSQDEIVAGLPELPQISAAEASRARGSPVSLKHFTELLSYVNPGHGRDGERYGPWRDIIAGARNMNVPEDMDGEHRLVILDQWSRGDLDRLDRGVPPTFDAEAVRRVWDTMPPRDDGVAYGTVFEAARASGYTGGPAVQGAAEAFGAAVAKLPQDGRFLDTLADVMRRSDPSDLVRGLIIERESACIYASPKSGKTFWTLDLALCIASARPAFGQFEVLKPGPVVYLSGEGNAGMKLRLMAWAAAHGFSPEEFHALPFYCKTAVPCTAKGAEEAKAYVDGIRAAIGRDPVLVIIDTMARSMAGLDENGSGDMGKYLDLTDGIRRALDCTMLTIAHAGKDERKGIRGNNAALAGFDSVYFMHKDAGKICWFESDARRDGDEIAPMGYRFKPVAIPGVEKPGFVLEPISPAEASAVRTQPLTKAEKKAAERVAVRKALHDVLTSLDAYGPEKGMTTQLLAEYLAGQRPPENDRKAYAAWETALNIEREKLKNGTRKERGNIFEGYYQPYAFNGAKENTRVWCLPEEAAEK